MYYKKRIIPLLLLTMMFSSCSFDNNSPNSSINNNGFNSSINNNQSSVKDAEDDYKDNDTPFSGNSDISTTTENEYIITSAGEYTFKGKIDDAQIIVRASSEDKVVINLEGVTMTSSTRSLIYVESGDKVTIKAKEGTYNELKDNRPLSLDSTIEDDAVIYSKVDLDIKGKGSLYVYTSFYDGIHTKKDLEIKNLTLKVDAINNAIKGNDSVTIESGNILAISRSGNGIKTSNSDISSKNKQRGNIVINGGNIEVYASYDGLDASYNVEIEETSEDEEISLKIYTDKYSSYSGEVNPLDGSIMYLRVMGRSLDESKRYAACFYNSDEDYIWKDAKYYKTITSDRGNNYYFYRVEVPENYDNVQWYRFTSSQTTNSFDDYDAKTEGGKINTNKDMYTITNVFSTTISGSWASYEQSNQIQSSHKSDHSAKGIKASNEVIIKSGTFEIATNDDGIHCNGGDLLENGETGQGNITISGGTFNILSTDDGVHADSIATFEGDKTFFIVNAYEGLEAQQIYIKDGEYYITASDDGINACTGSLKTIIDISGGYIDVTVGSGDTDAIDSNGDYRQTGGFVVARCGANDQSGNMAALDLDGTFYMTGGTFVGLGSMGGNLNNVDVNSIQFGVSSSSRPGGGGPGGWWAFGGGSSSYFFTSGSYAIENTTIAFNLSQTYSQLTICSDQLILNTDYVLTGTSKSYSWTQSEKHQSM